MRAVAAVMALAMTGIACRTDEDISSTSIVEPVRATGTVGIPAPAPDASHSTALATASRVPERSTATAQKDQSPTLGSIVYEQAPSGTSADLSPVVFPTRGATPGPTSASLLTGVLIEDQGCLWVVGDDGSGFEGSPVLIIWPYGYSARDENGFVVLDAKGNFIARVGDTIQIGGGIETTGAVSDSCAGPLWYSVFPIHVVTPAPLPVSSPTNAP